jgi:hypothetical protein
MKVNELRIGNWVNYEESPYQVWSEIRKNSVDLDDLKNKHVNAAAYDELQPIPLTEEWLLKFGFVSNPYQDRYEKGHLHIECDKTKGELMLWIDKLPYAKLIKSVHELQNLYFALTGNELEVKS